MGIYLNPGNGAFEMALNSEIYVDKTGMIRFLNTLVKTKHRYVCVSRARRFGKTTATEMLSAYYDREADSREMFEGLKVAEDNSISERDLPWDAYLNRFDVIRLVMTEFIKPGKPISGILKKLSGRILDDLSESYPEVKYDPEDLFFSMEKFSKKSGVPFIIIIDEWDAIFREYREDEESQKIYLDFLRDWMKDKEYIALAYMTGILPIKKYGKHSALNMFDEYSMMSPLQLAPYTGFTSEEVQELCARYGRDFDGIKAWYDGYRVSGVVPPHADSMELVAPVYSIYSPLSVIKAVSTGFIQNYWNKTETYEALAEYIRMDFDGLKETVAVLMDGGRVRIDTSNYENDMTTFHGKDDILSLLVHLGYLGYIGDDNEEKNKPPEEKQYGNGEVFIPNREILDEFRASTKSEVWADAFRAFRTSLKLLEATWDGDADKVASLLEDAHNRTGNKTYNDEAALSYAVQYAYYAAQKFYTTILELDSGKGYADIVYLPAPAYPDKPALLVELKYEKEVDSALAQIHRQKYPDRLEHYKGNLLLVGISYEKDASNEDADFKKHSCVIEKA